MLRSSRKAKPEDVDWRILLAVHLLSKPIILRLNLLSLLMQFREVVSSQQLTLPQEGVALWGASYIHRLRSEHLFQPAREPEEKPKPNLIVPPIIDIPVKPGMLSTTILEIVGALRAVMESATPTPTTTNMLQTDINLDRYLVKIEEEIEDFIKFLESLLSEADIFPLIELFRGVDRLEAARRFILLLIAAGRGVVELYEDEHTGRIFLKWRGSNVKESQA
ncbi:hypothetical protein HRbin02_01273 [Candidatus Calditenuaceae archaeon HR02]|nr:hypothetical protein HRbin02_01273 [Candidatus Calditenuaceae archaeon HR02]